MSIPCSGTGKYYNIEEYEKMAQEFKITFTLEQLNFVLKALGKFSFEQAAPLIQTINQQVRDQQSPDPVEEVGEELSVDDALQERMLED